MGIKIFIAVIFALGCVVLAFRTWKGMRVSVSNDEMVKRQLGGV